MPTRGRCDVRSVTTAPSPPTISHTPLC